MKSIFRHILAIGLWTCSLSVMAAPSSIVDTDLLPTTAPSAKTPVPAKVTQKYDQLATHFIKNNGQLDKWVSFYEKGVGHTVFFSKGEVVLLLERDMKNGPESGNLMRKRTRPEMIKLKFMHANPNPEIVGEALQVNGRINFVINGHIRQKSNAPAYKIIRYKDIYPGIDVKFYGRGQIFEYDFIVKEGADPSQIELAIEGAQALNVNDSGDLVIAMKKSMLIKKKPVVYQIIDGEPKIIAGKYVVNDYVKIAGKTFPFKFELAEYDSNYPLTIDPIFDYKSYLGF